VLWGSWVPESTPDQAENPCSVPLGAPETDPLGKLPKDRAHDKNRSWPGNIKVGANAKGAIVPSAADQAHGAEDGLTASPAISQFSMDGTRFLQRSRTLPEKSEGCL
jgi:hypothetical protein